MKKLFMFFLLSLFGLILPSVTAKAQYINGAPESQTTTPERINLLTMPEYIAAQEEARSGCTLFFIGFGGQLIGTTLIALSPSFYTKEAYTIYQNGFSMGEGYKESGDLVGAAIIGGSIFAVAGTIMEIVGLCKWINGAATMRDIRVAYSFYGNGVTFSF